MLEDVKNITPVFETAVNYTVDVSNLPDTDFMISMEALFEDEDTANKIKYVFDRMGIPMPYDEDDFLDGTEGALVALNKYGLVIRIEWKDSTNSRCVANRVNDSGFVLKPIASIDLGDVVMEVCPATEVMSNADHVDDLKDKLKDDGIDYWDCQLNNSGYLPVKTADFPKGIPIVIDRLAVMNLNKSSDRIRTALSKKVELIQDELYSPLRKSFSKEWHSNSGFKDFFDLCQQFKEDKKLNLGWLEVKSLLVFKTWMFKKKSISYEQRF